MTQVLHAVVAVRLTGGEYMAQKTIKTLFLDIGGVLLSNGWDRAARREAAKKFQLDFQEMDERHHLTFGTYEEGKLGLEEYLSRTVFCRERSFSRDAFVMFMYAQSHAYSDMIELMRALKSRHKLKLVAVSNEGRELTAYRIKRFELATFIDVFIFSGFVHARKPDYDIYRIAMDIAQANPEEIFYIDDRPMFVEVARHLGIRGLIHEDYAATRAALAGIGLSLPA